MSDHLPECPHANSRTATFYGGYCVCPLLRACEQRVRDAAREAASTQRCKFKARDWDDAIEAALAAIDALREEQK